MKDHQNLNALIAIVCIFVIVLSVYLVLNYAPAASVTSISTSEENVGQAISTVSDSSVDEAEPFVSRVKKEYPEALPRIRDVD